MYECTYCDDENRRFKCNYLKEYQNHLKVSHDISKKEVAMTTAVKWVLMLEEYKMRIKFDEI